MKLIIGMPETGGRDFNIVRRRIRREATETLVADGLIAESAKADAGYTLTPKGWMMVGRASWGYNVDEDGVSPEIAAAAKVEVDEDGEIPTWMICRADHAIGCTAGGEILAFLAIAALGADTPESVREWLESENERLGDWTGTEVYHGRV